MPQIIINGRDSIRHIDNIIVNLQARKFLLVCDSAFPYLTIKKHFATITVPFISFNEFSPNPIYDDICKGVELFNGEKCDMIIAVGGGSTIDVAKCIKLFCKMDSSINYIKQEYRDSGIPLIAIPTTAGTGSESTRYAVIYYEGQKQSITHNSLIPNYALLGSNVLTTLPIYQKKCTILDALCQGIESWWSVNSDQESKSYSKSAVETIFKQINSYIFDNDEESAEQIMNASNLAGRAINITQTTAAHAMSYKLTSMYKLPHGHAVAVCLPYIWRYMLDNLDRCTDPRGKEYLSDIFNQISNAMCVSSPAEAVLKFESLMMKMQMTYPETDSFDDIDVLAASVNPVRLNNNPVYLNKDVLYDLYKQIVIIRK